MRIRFAGLLILSAAILVGCSRQSPPGGPGAKGGTTGTTTGTKDTTTTTTTAPGTGTKDTTTTTTTTTDNKGDSKETFKINAPRNVNVTQGSTNNTSISLSRGSNFKQAVKLTFK